MIKNKAILFCLLLLPCFLGAQTPYFTAFGQLTFPIGDFGRESDNTDAFVDLGYGGGIDLNIHFAESLIWLTSLTFSANELDSDVWLNGELVLLSTSYSFYNLPVLTGFLFEQPLKNSLFGFWLQAGVNYAEFPSLSGELQEEFSIHNNFDSRIDSKTRIGYSLGMRVSYKKMVLAARYMNFGDYTFTGTLKSGKSAVELPLHLRSSVSFLMVSLGYNLDLLGER